MSIRYLSGIDVDANTLFVDSANDRVGIGTGSPTYKFEVSNGTITGTMNPNSSGFMFIGSTTNHPLYFGVYDATRMMISTAGNVGIGTTAPSTRFQVNKGSSGNVASFTTETNTAGAYAGITLNSTTQGADDWYGSEIRSINVQGNPNFLNPRLAFFVQNTNTYLPADRGEKMTINGDGNVGIGTTSPAYTLDVIGTARTTTGTYLGTSSGNVIVGGTTSDLIGGFKFIAIGNTAIQYAASTGTYLRIEPGAADTQVALKADARSGAYPPMAFHTSDTERMRITGAGNVGIGTTNTDPLSLSRERNLAIVTTGTNAALTIVGGAAGRIDFGVGSTRTGGIYSDSSNYTEIFTTTALPLVFSTNSAEKMRITSAGDVGIGMTSPAAKLDVSGSIQAGSGSTFGTGSNGASIYMSSASGLGLSGNLGGYSRNLIKTDGSSVIEIGDASTSLISAVNISAGDAAGVIALKTGGNNTRLYVNSSGNVGIGTTSPAAKLHVAYDDDFSLRIDGAGDIKQYRGNGSTGGLYLETALTSGSWGTNGGFVAISPRGTEAMRITAAGNVGIGTTSPNYLLDVKKDVNGTTTINVENQWGTSGAGANLFLTSLNVAGTSAVTAALEKYKNGSFYISNNETDSAAFTAFVVGISERMRITSAGNVGIGTTNGITTSTYTGKLAVYTASGANLALAAGTNTDNAIVSRIVGVNTNNGNSGNESAAEFYGVTSIESAITTTDSNAGSDSGGYIMFKTKPEAGALAEQMRITSGGNVGIGTTSPSQILHTVSTTDGAGPLFSNTAGRASITISSLNNGSNAYVNFNGSEAFLDYSGGTKAFRIATSNSSGYIAFETAVQSEKMRITSTGYVGIGTTAPTQKLDVVGNAIFSGNVGVAGKTPAFGLSLAQGTGAGNKIAWTDNAPNFAASIYANSSTDKLTFATKNASNVETIALEIDTLQNATFTGNVGIGTTSPASKLHIDNAPGSDVISISDAAGSVRLSLGQESSYTGNYIDSRNIDFKIKSYLAGGSGGNIFFQTGTGTATTKVTINVDGNVGIGTTSPIHKLEVGGNISINGGTFLDFANGDVRLVNGSGTLSIQTYSVSTGLTTKATITGTGNVGIGTTAPGARLQIGPHMQMDSHSIYGGIIGFNRNINTGAILNNSYGAYQFQNENGEFQFQVYNSSGGNVTIHRFLNNGNVSFAGNVGIGTTSPTAKLHVAGKPRIDSEYSPPPATTATVTDSKYYGFNSVVLTDPDNWLLVNIHGTDYVIPAYAL